MIKINGIEVTTTMFPDGQLHVKIDESVIFNRNNIVECRITNPSELFELLLVNDVIHPYNSYDLVIYYLMGGRMDRRIDKYQPFTLRIVTETLDKLCCKSLKLFDAHSDKTIELLKEGYPNDKCENILPYETFRKVLENIYHHVINPKNLILVIPDKGATERVEKLGSIDNCRTVQCLKHRDSQTGKLSGFEVLTPKTVKDKTCLIVDDICDGGGTFTGLAKELRKAGATGVNLYISHGIFSKGLPLEGIDHIWTTNSYKDEYKVVQDYPVTYPYLTMIKVW